MKISNKKATTELVSILFDQVEYYRQSRHESRRFLIDTILKMNIFQLFTIKSQVRQFLLDQVELDRKSATIIEQLTNLAESNPEAFSEYKKKVYG